MNIYFIIYCIILAVGAYGKMRCKNGSFEYREQ